MATSVSTTQPTIPNSNIKHSQNEANKLNEELNCARRALTYYNKENNTKILMLVAKRRILKYWRDCNPFP